VNTATCDPKLYLFGTVTYKLVGDDCTSSKFFVSKSSRSLRSCLREGGGWGGDGI